MEIFSATYIRLIYLLRSLGGLLHLATQKWGLSKIYLGERVYKILGMYPKSSHLNALPPGIKKLSEHYFPGNFLSQLYPPMTSFTGGHNDTYMTKED